MFKTTYGFPVFSGAYLPERVAQTCFPRTAAFRLAFGTNLGPTKQVRAALRRYAASTLEQIARVSISPSAAGSCDRRIPVPSSARSCETAAGREEDSDKWRVQSDESDSPIPESRFPYLAPSPCPRHSLISFIGGRVEEDEGIFFVGRGAAREVTPQPHDKQNVGPPARDGW